MDSLMSAEIKQSLFKMFDTDLDVKVIQELTFESLCKLDNNKSNVVASKTNEKSRKTANFTFLVPKDTIIQLKSGFGNNKIFFLHPIEGHVDQMVSLATYLNADVYGLQCTIDCKFKSIKEYAVYYENLIRKKQPNGPYVLCAYSYGILIVLELAIILESAGESVRIISVDSSPQYIRFTLNEYYDEEKEDFDIVNIRILRNFALRFPKINKEQVNIEELHYNSYISVFFLFSSKRKLIYLI